MELIELYNNIKNPIEDLEVIRKLIKTYAYSERGLGGFYTQLTRTVQKEHTQGKCYRQDRDKFFAMMFNKWKNSIVAMTRKEFNELYKQGSYKNDFIEMRKYLKNIPDVTTMQEANDIFFSDKGNKVLMDALEKYRWNSFGAGTGWVHVCSKYVTVEKEPYPNVEHRLYLDTESLDTYKIINLFVEKCDEYHLPYYFKFDQIGNRDDNIVIYSSTENLTRYIQILREIKKEHSELVSRVKAPPILTGKIDEWIGYGSEPSNTPDGKIYSFNEVRCRAIKPAIDYATRKWIMLHKNEEIMYQNKKISFQNYVAMRSMENFMLALEYNFTSCEEDEKRIAQLAGKAYNQSTVINKLGYTLQEVRSSYVRQGVYKVISENMKTLLPQACNWGYETVNPITIINARNGKQIAFNGYDLEKTIKELSVNIANNDPGFILSVQEKIKNNSKEYGIDVNKFCFDINAKEKIKIMAAQSADHQQFENRSHTRR